MSDKKTTQKKTRIFELFPELKTGKTRGKKNYALPLPEKGNPDFIPETDSRYILQEDSVYDLGLALKAQERILIRGHTGTGKTSLVIEVAARMKYELHRVNFDDRVERQDLIGEKEITNGQTVFRDGILPFAMQRPSILLLDEWDRISAEVAFVLQRLLEQDGKLMIMEDGGRVVTPHPDFRIIATANTAGQGDEEGIYAGSNVQSYAQVDRFTTCIQLDYLDKMKERMLIEKRFNAKKKYLSDQNVDAFVNVTEALKNAFVNRTISIPFSTRTLMSWIRKSIFVDDVNWAARTSFLNRMTSIDQRACQDIIRKAFPTGEI